jgi:hypothetical protein
MSGEGALHFIPGTDVDCGMHFDQRPGDLEATRGLVDPRAAFMVWAEQNADGWKVRVKVDQALSAEDAFKLAAEIQRLGDLIEGRAEF